MKKISLYEIKIPNLPKFDSSNEEDMKYRYLLRRSTLLLLLKDADAKVKKFEEAFDDLKDKTEYNGVSITTEVETQRNTWLRLKDVLFDKLHKLPNNIRYLRISHVEGLLRRSQNWIDMFGKIPSFIKYIDLSENNLTSLNITQLGNALRYIPENCISLNLGSNNLFKCRNLGNALRNIPKTVEHVDLSNNELNKLNNLDRALTCLPYVKELDLSNNNLYKNLNKLRLIPGSVRILTLCNNQLDKMQNHYCNALSNLPKSVRYVDLGHNNLWCNSSILNSILLKLPETVEHVNLRNNSLNQAAIGDLENTLSKKISENIKSLDLSYNGFLSYLPRNGGIVFSPLFAIEESVEYLSLNGVRLTPSSLETLLQLVPRSIKYLDLTSSSTEKEEVNVKSQLVEMEGNKELKSINISNNNLGIMSKKGCLTEFLDKIPKSVTSLNLSDNDLFLLEKFSISQNITSLNLSYNSLNLSRQPYLLLTVPNSVIKLNLSSNNLHNPEFPLERLLFFMNGHIQDLNLSDNNLHKLKNLDSVLAMTSLFHVSVGEVGEGSDFVETPSFRDLTKNMDMNNPGLDKKYSLDHKRRLTHLNLSSNQLYKSEDLKLSNLPKSIKFLGLGDNRLYLLESLDDLLSSIPESVVHLDLSNNHLYKLESLGYVLSKIPSSVKSLDLTNNGLEHLGYDKLTEAMSNFVNSKIQLRGFSHTTNLNQTKSRKSVLREEINGVNNVLSCLSYLFIKGIQEYLENYSNDHSNEAVNNLLKRLKDSRKLTVYNSSRKDSVSKLIQKLEKLKIDYIEFLVSELKDMASGRNAYKGKAYKITITKEDNLYWYLALAAQYFSKVNFYRFYRYDVNANSKLLEFVRKICNNLTMCANLVKFLEPEFVEVKSFRYSLEESEIYDFNDKQDKPGDVDIKDYISEVEDYIYYRNSKCKLPHEYPSSEPLEDVISNSHKFYQDQNRFQSIKIEGYHIIDNKIDNSYQDGSLNISVGEGSDHTPSSSGASESLQLDISQSEILARDTYVSPSKVKKLDSLVHNPLNLNSERKKLGTLAYNVFGSPSGIKRPDNLAHNLSGSSSRMKKSDEYGVLDSLVHNPLNLDSKRKKLGTLAYNMLGSPSRIKKSDEYGMISVSRVSESELDRPVSSVEDIALGHVPINQEADEWLQPGISESGTEKSDTCNFLASLSEVESGAPVGSLEDMALDHIPIGKSMFIKEDISSSNISANQRVDESLQRGILESGTQKSDTYSLILPPKVEHASSDPIVKPEIEHASSDPIVKPEIEHASSDSIVKFFDGEIKIDKVEKGAKIEHIFSDPIVKFFDGKIEIDEIDEVKKEVNKVEKEVDNCIFFAMSILSNQKSIDRSDLGFIDTDTISKKCLTYQEFINILDSKNSNCSARYLGCEFTDKETFTYVKNQIAYTEEEGRMSRTARIKRKIKKVGTFGIARRAGHWAYFSLVSFYYVEVTDCSRTYILDREQFTDTFTKIIFWESEKNLGKPLPPKKEKNEKEKEKEKEKKRKRSDNISILLSDQDDSQASDQDDSNPDRREKLEEGSLKLSKDAYEKNRIALTKLPNLSLTREEGYELMTAGDRDEMNNMDDLHHRNLIRIKDGRKPLFEEDKNEKDS